LQFLCCLATSLVEIQHASSRLAQQIQFVEIDKLKRVLRQTLLMDGTRQENSAEHSGT